MQILLTLAVAFTFALSLLQCGGANAETAKIETNSPAAAELPDNAPRISLADAKKAFDEGGVLFIDTRGADQYKQEHIKGAINIPADAFESRYSEVPKDKKIIAYCS
ncbi:MAG: hypothetical protein JSS81_27065 [Acidobacteria bacterium]|nr:hypothetical protein [Acidobacteriota bacterium]